MKDKCQICLGAKGGVLGNENVFAGIIVCDYCTMLVMRILHPKGEPSDREKPEPPAAPKLPLGHEFVMHHMHECRECGAIAAAHTAHTPEER